KAKEEGTHTYVLFPVLSDGSTNLKNNKDVHTNGKEHDDDIQKSICDDQTKEQDDKAENKDKGKSPVVTITGFRDLNEEFAECINNSSNGISAAGPSIPAAGLDFTNSTNDFSAAGPSVSADGLNFTNSTNDFSAAGPLNADMPNLEDLSHNADVVGVEADINNMESIILVSLIPTTRIHKDHLTSQIIGDLSSTTQTRSMVKGVRDQGGISQMFNVDFHTYVVGAEADINNMESIILTRSMVKGVRDQGGISQMFNEDFHTCMFACFLLQEEPKRIHQALKHPSWIEAMQEELLQFKMQKV
nr:hypothetical protein [Tanacetum cinerariifolium]